MASWLIQKLEMLLRTKSYVFTKVANSKNLESCDTTYCHKTVRDLSVREVTTTDFCSDATSEPIKSVLPRKAVHKSLSSKHLSRASVSTSSVEGNVSISVSHTSASLDRSSLVFNIQEYCNLFFSGSFNIKIPLQNVLIVHIFFVFFFCHGIAFTCFCYCFASF